MYATVSPVPSFPHTASRARQRACQLGLGINFGAAAACPQNQISVLPKPVLVSDEELQSPVREAMTAVPEYPPATELCLIVAYGYWDDETRGRFYDLYLHEVRIAQFEAFQSQRTDVPVDAIDEGDLLLSHTSSSTLSFLPQGDISESQAYHLAKEVKEHNERLWQSKPIALAPAAIESALEQSVVEMGETDLRMEIDLHEFVDVDLASPITLSPVTTSIFARALMTMPSPLPSGPHPLVYSNVLGKTTFPASSPSSNRPILSITIPSLSRGNPQVSECERIITSHAKVLSPSSALSPRQLPPAPQPALKALPGLSPNNSWTTSPWTPDSSPAPSTPGDDEPLWSVLRKRKHADQEDLDRNFYGLKTNSSALRKGHRSHKMRTSRRSGSVYAK